MQKTESLFDRFINEVSLDIQQSFQHPHEIQQDKVVHYTSGRTGHKAITTAGRYKAALDLVPGLRKRYIGPTSGPSVSDSERRREAELDFLASNERCRVYNEAFSTRTWNAFVQTVSGEVKSLLYNVLEVGRSVTSFYDRNDEPMTLGEISDSGAPSDYVVEKGCGTGNSYLTLDLLARGLRAGPGSSAGVAGPGNAFTRSCLENMTFSSESVQRLYKTLCSTTILGFSAEKVRHSLYGSGDLVDAIAMFSSVPKTNLKNRGICKQPSGNMHIQLSVHEILRFILLEHLDCDLRVQQFKNRELAYLGSLETVHGLKRSWSFCTEDLSEASNFPQILIQEHFPDNWYEFLVGIRSPKMVVGDPSRPGAEVVTKHIMSTMGNGYTFSLMTLFLSAIVKVLYKLQDLPEYDVINGTTVKTWAVYGDDIIVDRSVWNALQQVLQAFGFIVNKDKSFARGSFRESCGADFYYGYNVRPVFCEKLQTQADVFSLLNRLTLWGHYHSIELPRALSFLRRSAMDLGNELRVPNWEDVSHGIHVPKRFCKPEPHTLLPTRLRLCPNDGKPLTLDGIAYRTLRPVSRVIHLISEKSVILRYTDIIDRTEKGFPMTTYRVPNRGKKDGKKLEKLDYMWKLRNMPGFIQHMIGGTVRNGTYSIRRDGDTVYEEQVHYAPGWNDARVLLDKGDFRPHFGISKAALAPYMIAQLRLWEEYVARNMWSKTFT